MWNIKDIKSKSRKTLKSNLWTLLLLGLFMTIVIGRYMINNDAFSNLKIIYEYVKDRNVHEVVTSTGREEIINKYADEVISQFATGRITGIINSYNEEHNITKGALYTTFHIITKGQMQLQNIIKSIESYENKETLKSTIFLAASCIGLLIRIFIASPIRIGENRIYLESLNYKKTRIKRLTYGFKKGRYWGSVKSMLLMEVRKFLWNLTIVGGFIKNYSYKMVTYIVAENPKIKPKDAIKMSEEMMYGNKLKAFKLDLSFLGWIILQYATFGIAGIYVSPYYSVSYTQLYEILRKEYIENKKYNYKLLNDEKLFEENDLDKYPDVYEMQKKKIKIDYNKKYELTSIILFFFIFSFVGWVWEVALYLFRDGIWVNRGTMYGPWLPIYGTGCTLIILLTRFKSFRKLLKNSFLTFLVIVVLCSVIEYLTSWFIEATSGLKYWDYTGVFGNINGRICFECSVFFGLGGCLCVYIVAPFLERKIQVLTNKVKITLCTVLLLLFGIDVGYSHKYPHTGEGITINIENIEDTK